MSQYRKYAVEDQEIRQLLDNYREGESTKPRFSLNLPDCSLVLDSPNSNNLLDTNEISWLQKFAEENDKMCNSNILEEREESIEEIKDKDQMKFSFNQNYAFPQRDQLRQRKEEPTRAQHNREKDRSDKENQQKISRDTSVKQLCHERSNQHLLKDIQNTKDQKKAVRTTEKSVGSIKRNKPPKLDSAEQFKRDFFNEEQHKEVAENISMYKLEEMTEKLNTILSKGKLETTAHYNLQSERFKAAINQKLNQLAQDKIIPDRKPIFKREPQIILCENQQNLKIFTPKQVASPLSMNTKGITPAATPIGSITGSLECLFDMLDLTYTGKLTKTNCRIERIPEDFKFIFGSIFTRIKFKNLVCNKRQFVKLCQNIIKEIDSDQIINNLCQLQPVKVEEDNQDILKEIRDKDYEEQEERVILINRNHDNFSKTSYSSQKDRKQSEPTRKKSCFEINPIGDSNSKLTVDSRYEYSREKPSQNGSIERYSKKSINESTLRQHKKGLDDLMKLSNKMENYLSTKMLSEHSGTRNSRDESLRFDELVKHI